jgi:hypothetical protein
VLTGRAISAAHRCADWKRLYQLLIDVLTGRAIYQLLIDALTGRAIH